MIKINDRVIFIKCRSNLQTCIHCNKQIGKGKLGLSLSNRANLCNKNVWLHITCIGEFTELLIKSTKEHQKRLVAEVL